MSFRGRGSIDRLLQFADVSGPGIRSH
jgi:hypothetical protein